MTDYHTKYIAHELTRRCGSDSVEKLTAVLSDAQVQLNPHQIEAALFAFRNPLSRGAILVDETALRGNWPRVDHPMDASVSEWIVGVKQGNEQAAPGVGQASCVSTFPRRSHK
jgi:hypothetical protein